jgi:hypothetical protein
MEEGDRMMVVVEKVFQIYSNPASFLGRRVVRGN